MHESPSAERRKAVHAPHEAQQSLLSAVDVAEHLKCRCGQVWAGVDLCVTSFQTCRPISHNCLDKDLHNQIYNINCTAHTSTVLHQSPNQKRRPTRFCPENVFLPQLPTCQTLPATRCARPARNPLAAETAGSTCDCCGPHNLPGGGGGYFGHSLHRGEDRATERDG